MKKIVFTLFLFLISFSFAYSANINEKLQNIKDEVTKNVQNIKNTLKKYQLENNYIDYNYPGVSFNGFSNGIGTSDMNITISIKDKNNNFIDYNGVINIKPLMFGEGFSYGDIPNNIIVKNGKGFLTIKVTQNNGGLENDSGLGFILTSEKKDLVGNIGVFSHAANFININDYLPQLLPENFDDNIVSKEKTEIINNSEYTLYNPEKPNINEFQSINLNDNGELVIEYDKNYYNKLMKVYGGKGILGFDSTDKHKYNFTYDIKIKDKSVFITIKKENIGKILEFYSKIKGDYGNGDIYKDTILFTKSFPTYDGSNFSSNIDETEIINLLESLYKKDYVSLGKIFDKGIEKAYKYNETNISLSDFKKQTFGAYNIII